MVSKYTIWWLFLGMVALCCPMCSPQYWKDRELTEQHGAELRAAYEKHHEAELKALATGNVSELPLTTTGWELKELTEFAQSASAPKMLEARKKEISSFSVKEYSPPTATVFMSLKITGSIRPLTASQSANICELQQENGVWKVAKCGPPNFD